MKKSCSAKNFMPGLCWYLSHITIYDKREIVASHYYDRSPRLVNRTVRVRTMIMRKNHTIRCKSLKISVWHETKGSKSDTRRNRKTQRDKTKYLDKERRKFQHVSSAAHPDSDFFSEKIPGIRIVIQTFVVVLFGVLVHFPLLDPCESIPFPLIPIWIISQLQYKN